MRLNRAAAILNLACLSLAGAVLCGMVFLAVLNVVLGIFGEPVKGTFELMGFGGALLASLALGDSQARRAHIQVNILEGLLPRPVRRFSEAISLFAAQAFFLLVAWQMLKLGLELKEFGELSETLHLPFYPLLFVVGGGFILLVLNLAVQTAAAVWGVRK
ncbi:MAG: TRAP transporter small permease [Desulfonatronovibrionaceae bacterium]